MCSTRKCAGGIRLGTQAWYQAEPGSSGSPPPGDIGPQPEARHELLGQALCKLLKSSLGAPCVYACFFALFLDFCLDLFLGYDDFMGVVGILGFEVFVVEVFVVALLVAVFAEILVLGLLEVRRDGHVGLALGHEAKLDAPLARDRVGFLDVQHQLRVKAAATRLIAMDQLDVQPFELILVHALAVRESLAGRVGVGGRADPLPVDRIAQPVLDLAPDERNARGTPLRQPLAGVRRARLRAPAASAAAGRRRVFLAEPLPRHLAPVVVGPALQRLAELAAAVDELARRLDVDDGLWIDLGEEVGVGLGFLCPGHHQGAEVADFQDDEPWCRVA